MIVFKRSVIMAICGVGFGASLFLTGLQHFVHDVRLSYHTATYQTVPEATEINQALTGIVVATGSNRRVSTGMTLLSNGEGGRLLISGTGAGVSKADLLALLRDGSINRARLQSIMTCCVDLGSAAMNTKGNAEEAATWFQANNFSRIILVTADYHMPRSLIHFSQALPEAEIIPYAVPSYALMKTASGFSEWWAKPSVVIMLSREYGKYLISSLV
ncbi:MAG: hypothetical protein CBC12_10540 [Candidatus Puniceispirillum sp. TMED52]|nr:hypothetical protein [SAR116 cluster bacterium]OUU46854.1 MAG: hypothetical protein CBC12_10540 [Candidatus Puniceispirillum sp. TMED52]HCP17677.1 hypothetical protein [Alphaproteobacteria bacterium]|tara:strand:- start:837 stop:1484 length:648 start_codon:yes stop_codon:yes gene_type:complete